MTASLALRLGRVSNLPTVWSNVAAGFVLAGGALHPVPLLTLMIAASAFYVGGMFLNDAYDAEIDARERPERPIPSGEVTRDEVLRWGYGWLGLGLGCVSMVSRPALIAALATCGLIVLYDRWHKGNPLGPLVMGLCRVGLYLMAASCAGGVTGAVGIGAALLLGWVIGLTYVAKHEGGGRVAGRWPLALLVLPLLVHVPLAWRGGLLGPILLVVLAVWIQRALRLVRRGGPSIRTAVVSLIAGISLVDALLILGVGLPGGAWLAIAAFMATLASQRWVAGT